MNRTDGLRSIFERHGSALVLYARQWCRFPEDALQEAMIELAKQSPTPADPVAWLFRAVRFRAINISRAESRRTLHQQHAAQDQDEWFVKDPATNIEINELRLALEDLQALDREIVVARVWGGLSYEQIAVLVELSTSSVHRRYHAALIELQRCLEGNIQSSSCHE